ncbi:MAG: hypothetical protein M3N18_00470 [Actinomycetota bacterium]|nr:hypothetical protein [Actinomycetota bacterium]
MPIREYARALGVVLVLTGAIGLVFGDWLLLGAGVVVPKGIAHLLAGGLLIYIGFGQTDEELARTAVAAIGVVYLLVGVLGLALSTLLGLYHGYGAVENIVHLLVGILSLVISFGSGRDTASKA